MQTRSTMLLVFLCLSFAAQGISAAEFNVDFVKRPSLLRYSKYYGKYELILDLKITEGGDPSPGDKRVVSGINVKADAGTSHPDFGATVMARVLNGGTDGQLVFLCSSLRRCLHIRNEIATSPSFIQHAVEFAPYGLQAGLPTQFHTVRSAGLPAPGPVIPEDRSNVVFQRHLDNSLSFAQNWNAYVNGFGDPSGNYWMGLEQLTALTKDRNCKWIIQLTLFNGKVLKVTYKDFQVLGAEENYRLQYGGAEGADPIYKMQFHNNSEFSTFDRDNDAWSGSCSKQYGGRGGWWFRDCRRFNPNAPINSKPNSNKLNSLNEFSEVLVGNEWHCIKSSELSFNCN